MQRDVRNLHFIQQSDPIGLSDLKADRIGVVYLRTIPGNFSRNNVPALVVRRYQQIPLHFEMYIVLACVFDFLDVFSFVIPDKFALTLISRTNVFTGQAWFLGC